MDQAFLNGMSHDAQWNWFYQMSYPQRTAWWAAERHAHPERWFQHRGRSEYHRAAVNNEAPAVFLLEEAREEARSAAFAAAYAARVALRALVPVVESVSGSSSDSGSASDNGNDDDSGSASDSDSPEVIVVED